MKFVEVLKLSETPLGTKKHLMVEGHEICVYHLSDGVFATTDICSHQRALLSAGFLHDDAIIECPRHGSQFDIRTGAVKSLPATTPIETYPVKVEGDAIFVGLS